MSRTTWSAALVLGFCLSLSAEETVVSGLTLARELSDGASHVQAALEYRRLAIQSDQPSEQGAFYWMAGYEYLNASRFEQAARMLSQAENATPDLENEVYLLRSEQSRSRYNLSEAAFYLENLITPERPVPMRTLAARRLAGIRLQMQNVDGAREALQGLEGQSIDEELAAISRYERGKDKSPVTGGLLGLIPGLGYAYSGEYANAARSLILNALCIWGVVEFAEDEQWGGVAVVGFAEVTFYSGSIYGGADAAVRYNDRRLQEAVRVIDGKTAVRPDLDMLPVLKLQYEF